MGDNGWDPPETVEVACEECCGGCKDCDGCDGEGSGVCDACKGLGAIQDEDTGQALNCPDCKGSGKLDCPDCDGDGVRTCSNCEGTGEVDVDAGQHRRDMRQQARIDAWEAGDDRDY